MKGVQFKGADPFIHFIHVEGVTHLLVSAGRIQVYSRTGEKVSQLCTRLTGEVDINFNREYLATAEIIPEKKGDGFVFDSHSGAGHSGVRPTQAAELLEYSDQNNP